MQHVYAFEKMVAWQIARQTSKSLYMATKAFPKEELFGDALRTEFQKITYHINKLVNRSTDNLQEPEWPYSPS